MSLENENNAGYLERWKTCKPDAGLTWGMDVLGDNFINLAVKRKVFDKNKSILELGPGYGRMPKSLLALKIPFSQYTGVDISNFNLEYLRENFKDERMSFVYGSFEEVVLPGAYDIVISSAVLKHQYPNFEKSLRNILQFVRPGGVLFFDLLENRDIHSENKDISNGPRMVQWEREKNNTHLGWYTQREVMQILHNLNLKFIAFDHVIHHPRMEDRLVVIAKKKLAGQPPQ